LALALTSVGLYACTYDDPAATNSNASPRPSIAPTGACALITTADAAALLGEPTSTAYDNPGRAGTSQCTFANSPNSDLRGANKVVIGIDASPSAKGAFATAKASSAATPVPGLGDDAFSTTGVTGNVAITVLEGSTVLSVSLGTSSVTYTPEQQATNLTALKTLITSVLTKL
jgi:hypothetical protein